MTTREIDKLLEEDHSLKLVTAAYSDIASIKIKRIRNAVERNRLFFEEISKTYGYVKAYALKKNIVVAKSKKRLAILLTSNYRFYGNINSSLIKYFIGSVEELADMDKIILGRGGIDYFKATKSLKNYKEIMLKTDLPTAFEITDMVKIISQYNQVLVFYSKLKSLLSQRATFTDLTATSFYTRSFYLKDEKYFIFEPELPKILAFFDSQILTLLLEQTFLESELSRTASRFISMDQAQLEANKYILEHQKLKAHTYQNLQNIKILENFATLMATRKGHP